MLQDMDVAISVMVGLVTGHNRCDDPSLAFFYVRLRVENFVSNFTPTCLLRGHFNCHI